MTILAAHAYISYGYETYSVDASVCLFTSYLCSFIFITAAVQVLLDATLSLVTWLERAP